jgi:Fe-S-cluster containining protein
MVTILEGLILLRYIRENGLWTSTLRQRLEAHRDKTINLAHDVWILSNTPCPLLEDNLCVAYEARPLHCRVTFSVGDPEKCHPHELGDQTRLIPNTQIIIDYNEKLMDTLKKLDTVPLLFTVSEAILLAREVEVGEITLEDVIRRYREDLLRG